MLLSCSAMANAATKNIKVSLSNPLNVKRADVPVVISLKDVPFNVVDAVVTADGKEIPSQIDDLDMDLRNDELAFVTDMDAKQKKTLSVTLYSEKQADRNYPRRTYGDLIVRDSKTKKKNKFPGYIHSLVSSRRRGRFPHGSSPWGGLRVGACRLQGLF